VILNYHKKERNSISPVEFKEALEEIAREGARRMILKALDSEVQEFLGRERYGKSLKFKGYRNGFGKERSISIGFGEVKIRQPRVSDVPPELGEEGFNSRILASYQRSSWGLKKILSRLYLEGLSSGDFEPVFRGILGESAALSSSAILRLKEDWRQEYESWSRRSFGQEFYAYVWVDGVYLKAGLEREKTALLCALGVREDGSKELLAMGEGYRESKASWAEVLRDLKNRGLKTPRLFIGDGALGIWSALDEIYPQSAQQRCWNHKIMNVMDKLPKALQREAGKRLREIYQADTRSQCEEWADIYARDLRAIGQNGAADCLLRDFDKMTAFYDFPKAHWFHLRTTNPLESIFSGVRLRTNVVKRFRGRENARYMIFKLIERLSLNWRPIRERRLLQDLKAGRKFSDGILMEEKTQLAA